jgi:molybdate transport system substrate-binding protein
MSDTSAPANSEVFWPRAKMGLVKLALLLLGLFLSGCARPRVLTVAAASSLADTFAEIGAAFTGETAIPLVFQYGASATLAQQIGQGAPVDAFASADLAHLDSVGALMSGKTVFAQGRLALWSPKVGLKSLEDLQLAQIRFIALAQPDLAPYGRAAVNVLLEHVLREQKLWDVLEPKLVYANSVAQAKQLADSGNADAAFVAYSQVVTEAASSVLILDNVGLEQWIGALAASPFQSQAQRFVAFLQTEAARKILRRHGYLTK